MTWNRRMRKIPAIKQKRYMDDRTWKTRFVAIRYSMRVVPQPFPENLYYAMQFAIAGRKKDGRLVWRAEGALRSLGVSFDADELMRELERHARIHNRLILRDTDWSRTQFIRDGGAAHNTPVNCNTFPVELYNELRPEEKDALKHWRIMGELEQ